MRRTAETFLIESALLSMTLFLVLRWTFIHPLRRTVEGLKRLRLGQSSRFISPISSFLFDDLSKEVDQLTTSLLTARAVAEMEARLRHSAESLWTPERLQAHIRSKLQNRPLFVISNREPYQHIRKGNRVEWMVPPSGLVTALEPILRACGGLWIAQATGNADREAVDSHDKLLVPPDGPRYTLRRLWISEAEEKGFYYGFSNEGLWPLCHIAHTRPLFRPEDWTNYYRVNRKFADAALEEMQGAKEPYVLVQDYHFALLPQMIKEKRPDARVALFWHIPWPNPESFGICPWRRELLHGMLGADLIGFHIQYHCNNFLDTIDGTLEARVDRERFAILRGAHTTCVKPFPISVAFAPLPRDTALPDGAVNREKFLKPLGIHSRYLGIGVDRVDYTKGILERFRGIERFLELNPTVIGDFTFIELAAPSRTLIPRYHQLIGEMHAEADRINARFRTKDWAPIVILEQQHSHQDIEPFYKLAQVCMVTSLHDGMNLVAKEFVAARNDEDGVLILSPFTGASRELQDALIANPYDVEQLARTLRQALDMPAQERRARMRQMREFIREHNIYRWGANLVSELAQIRISVAAAQQPTGAQVLLSAVSLEKTV